MPHPPFAADRRDRLPTNALTCSSNGSWQAEIAAASTFPRHYLYHSAGGRSRADSVTKTGLTARRCNETTQNWTF
jgi:hypothetical protein